VPPQLHVAHLSAKSAEPVIPVRKEYSWDRKRYGKGENWQAERWTALKERAPLSCAEDRHSRKGSVRKSGKDAPSLRAD